MTCVPDLRPAIVFPSLDKTESFLGRDYWTEDQWWWAEGDGVGLPSEVDKADHLNLVSVTYDVLLYAARRCANQISKVLDDLPQVNGEDRSLQPQPIVGVAIPEGPLLPLSVLALHMIQLRHSNCPDDNSLSRVPIILPLDPDEPVHRLGQILNDAPPDLVLCATDIDAAKLAGAVSIVSELSTKMVNLVDLLGSSCDFMLEGLEEVFASTYPWPPKYPDTKPQVVSHICFTSGTSGRPKGCTSSLSSLISYLHAKNLAHNIQPVCTMDTEANAGNDVVFLASSISFDPCFSDVLATFACLSSNDDDNTGSMVGATLAIAPRTHIFNSFATCLGQTGATHVLCTPTLWSTISVGPADLPCLRVVALGGERIPRRIVKRWARKRRDGPDDVPQQRLLATYGTTEACVYQTCGEVYADDSNTELTGQDVGLPLPGNIVRVCTVPSTNISLESLLPASLDDVVGSGPKDGVGEVVLAGQQLDSVSSYWKRHDLSIDKFICADRAEYDEKCIHYRTGDLGYLDPSGRLHVLGRIAGEDGMVKINGLRIELGEVENSIIDDDDDTDLQQQRESSEFDSKLQAIGISPPSALVTGCAVVANANREGEHSSDERTSLTAYCVLSEPCLRELGLDEWTSPNNDKAAGFILSPGTVLHMLFRIRTASRVRRGCVPSNFVIISRVPLSGTGKCDRKRLPAIEKCLAMASDADGSGESGQDQHQPLRERGNVGSLVSRAIASALNLPSATEASLTSSSNFATLGGDSLTATRVVRSLYASHNSLLDGRNLGGRYGQLEGAFSVNHLLSARTLGAYVDLLDSRGVCASNCDINQHPEAKGQNLNKDDESNDNEREESAEQRDAAILTEALMEATTSSLTTIASHLLKAGADPNFAQQGKDQRLGKLADKRERRKIFRSSPLHLACIKGDDVLAAALIKHGAKCKIPDAAGSLPLHLNCSGKGGTYSEEEDERRLRIARLLLEYVGVPLSVKDANRQTVLHATARSGHLKLLRYLMSSWKRAGDEGLIHIYPPGIKGGRYDWQDRWFRTPVHWAVLNGNVEALEILLEGGCSPTPSRPKASVANRKTSAAVESPLEICERLYGLDSVEGRQIYDLLSSG